MDKEKARKMLRYYLDPFYVDPMSDSQKIQTMAWKLDTRSRFLAFHVNTRKEIKQVAQYYLLRHNERLFWKAYNIYDFMNIYFENIPVIPIVNAFPLIIIYQTGQELGGEKLDPLIDNMTNQVIDSRIMLQGYRTLFLTMATNRQFSFKVEELFEFSGVKSDAI